MRAFVTGLDGFVGQWLARHLVDAGDDVAGGSREAHPSFSIVDAAEARRLTWFSFELRDRAALSAALEAWRPDAVYHLAAQASVAASFDDPLGTIEANVSGAAQVAEAVRAAAPHATLLYAGSAEAYGAAAAEDLPIRETAPLRPNNPYAASKAAGELVALQYAHAAALRVVATRSFNHTGPGQRTSFSVPAFAAQIAAVAEKRHPPVLRVGNLESKRDFLDVRDVVRAYRLLVERGKSGSAYNVCSGTSVSMRWIVDELVRAAEVELSIEVDSARLRRVDTPEMVGDNSRLRADTGWSPNIPLSQTLADLYAWHANQKV